VGEERLKVSVRPETFFPYALDEPTESPNLTISAPGGNSAVVSMNSLGSISQLTYDNFFYIAFTTTFPRDETCISRHGVESLQLVLDVPEGTKVVLSKKQHGQR